MKYSRMLLAEIFIFSPSRVQTPNACFSTKNLIFSIRFTGTLNLYTFSGN